MVANGQCVGRWMDLAIPEEMKPKHNCRRDSEREIEGERVTLDQQVIKGLSQHNATFLIKQIKLMYIWFKNYSLYIQHLVDDLANMTYQLLSREIIRKFH